MPKIIINEYDKTKAGGNEYGNFTVVVPGPICAETDVTVFDDYGIYECSSVKDFINNIKKIKGQGVAPTLYDFSGEEKKGIITKKLTEEEFTETYKNKVYDWKVTDAVNQVGYLVWQHPVTKRFVKLAKATVYNPDFEYAVIVSANNEGIDAVSNQYALELLSLGYTILYKKYDIITELRDPDFWHCLKDKSLYDFRYITTGGVFDVPAYEQICKIATFKNVGLDKLDEDTYDYGRGDCIALIDIIEKELPINASQQVIINKIATQISGFNFADKFCGIFGPRVIYSFTSDDEFNNNTFPGSFHYLACAANAFIEKGYPEWFAPAGLNRGICNYQVVNTTLQLGEMAVNTLESRTIKANLSKSMNLVTKIRGVYYLWGNRTAHSLDNEGLVASHFLNIRQLCCTLKKQVYEICKSLQFDPNSDILWVNFKNALTPTLDRMKANQGIKDYKLVKIENNLKALVTAKIRIVPIEAVEDFHIGVYLEDSVSGVTVSMDEE